MQKVVLYVQGHAPTSRLKRVLYRGIAAMGLAAGLLALPTSGGSLTTGPHTPVVEAAPEPAQRGCPPQLARGSRGDHVEYLQILLNEHLGVPLLEVDGIFGGNTYRLVRQFQEGTGLPVDGIVGPRTWRRLGVC